MSSEMSSESSSTAATIAFIFPGQGSQAVGMGKDLAESHPEARAVFERADEALGEKLSTLIFEGPQDELTLTANGQPAILTTSIACLETLRGQAPVELAAPGFVAGHSLGEYSALVAAGSLTLEDAVRTVRRRGQLMQEAVPVGQGAMAALLAMDPARLPELLEEASGGEVLEAANYNGPDQVVIAGAKGAVDRAVAMAHDKGARKAVLLPVSAPFHCRLMQPAADRLTPLLRELTLSDLMTPLCTNVDAQLIRTGVEARDALERQVVGAVRWQESMWVLWDGGVRTFVEVGPGRVLSGLVKRIVPREARIRNVQDARSLAKLLEEVA